MKARVVWLILCGIWGSTWQDWFESLTRCVARQMLLLQIWDDDDRQ
jgi:hypothetical protein